VVGSLRNHEKLLLETQSEENLLCVFAESLKQTERRGLHHCLRFPENGFVVESLAVVGDEEGRNVHYFVFLPDEDLGEGVSDHICTGSVSVSQTS